MHSCSVSTVVSDSLQPKGPSPPGSSVHGILQAQKRYLKFFTSLDIYFFSDGSKALSLALTHLLVSSLTGKLQGDVPPLLQPVKCW